jgi:hypothetical protein
MDNNAIVVTALVIQALVVLVLAGVIAWLVAQHKHQQKALRHQAYLEERGVHYRKTVYKAWDTVDWVYFTTVSELFREGKVAEALAKLTETEVLVTDACQAEEFAGCAKSTSQLLRTMQKCALLKTAALQALHAAMLANAQAATPSEQTDGLLATP